MREIKFRAWDKVLNQHLYNVQNHINDIDWAFGSILKNTERYIVEQFTGLQDKNGKDIYEGDIVKLHEISDRIRVVDFNNGCFEIYYITKGAMRVAYPINEDNGEIEVVGNIHENPELLKTDK